jgi:hypothetical protein
MRAAEFRRCSAGAAPELCLLSLARPIATELRRQPSGRRPLLVLQYRRLADLILERSEFDQAKERLKKAGYRCRGAEEAWREFARLRSKYASPLNQLARQLAIIPAQWIGDRSYLPHRERERPLRKRRTPRK